MVNGKQIYEKKLSKKELNMCENFNFSLKYIIKYLNLKNKAEKEKNENEEEFQDRIIFYIYGISNFIIFILIKLFTYFHC